MAKHIKTTLGHIEKVIRQYKKGVLFNNTEEQALKDIKEYIKCYETVRNKEL